MIESDRQTHRVRRWVGLLALSIPFALALAWSNGNAQKQQACSDQCCQSPTECCYCAASSPELPGVCFQMGSTGKERCRNEDGQTYCGTISCRIN